MSSSPVAPLPRIARLSLGAAIAFAAFGYAFHLMGGDFRFLAQQNMALIVAGGPVAMLASSRSLQRLSNAALAAGVIAVIMGLAHVMSNLDHPETIGLGIAVSLVPMVYALGVSFTFGNAATRTPRVPDLLPYALMAITFLLLLTFAVLYALRQ